MTFNPLAHSVTRDSTECLKDKHLIGNVFTACLEYIFVILQERNIQNNDVFIDKKFYEILEIRQIKPGENLILIDIFEANLTSWKLESEFDYEQEEFYRKVKLFCFLHNNEKICFISKDDEGGVSDFFDLVIREDGHG